ncbi:single-stranded DNA-binding protein [Demequina aurantiaca]|uniref:single-stranded DNA-binding protein n=1 Tax=Demequina aurantiaca TaxID=676200 RepID=UPI0007833C3E|nr:single-stranded DNA-binding protein [Demequina aurantiaca]
MNDLTMTVSGWAATDPKLVLSASGVNMCTFRLASTSRYFDRDKNDWVDGRTEWFSVRVFRAAATMVSKSIAKGQPVSVTGRFKTNEWEAQDGPRTDLVIDAITVGHDLTRGVADFTRATAEDADAEPKPSSDAAEVSVDDTAELSEELAAVEEGDAELEDAAA